MIFQLLIRSSVTGNLPLQDSQAGAFPLNIGRLPKYTQRCEHIIYTMHKIIRIASGKGESFYIALPTSFCDYTSVVPLKTASRHSSKASLWQQTQSRHGIKEKFVPLWAFSQISRQVYT